MIDADGTLNPLACASCTEADQSGLGSAGWVRAPDSGHRVRLRDPAELHRWGKRAHNRLRDHDHRGLRDLLARPSRRTAALMRRPAFIARQAARPTGLLGRVLVALMARETRDLNE